MTERPAGVLRRRVQAIAAPLAVASVPVVYLWTTNLEQGVAVFEVLSVLLAVWSATLLILAMSWLAYRDVVRAAIATSLLMVLLLSFGHVAREADASPGTRELTVLLVAFGALASAGLVVISRGRVPERLLSSTTFVASGILIVNVVSIVATAPALGSGATAGDDVDVPGIRRPAGGAHDVYYLVFDRYANGEVLEELYGFENDTFLRGLESRGFTVVRDAVANYPGTRHSLASSLNVSYLDDLAHRVGVSSDAWGPLDGSLTDSVVTRSFDRIGYRTVHVGSWWGPTFQDPTADVSYLYRPLREFTSVFLSTTALPYVGKQLGLVDAAGPYEEQYHRVRYQARSIAEVSRDPRPTFTFAHFTLPHDPYVFDATGAFVPPSRTRPIPDAYLEQLRYTNSLIDQLVDRLLTGDPATDPIVILQSDEGPHPIDTELDRVRIFDWPREPQRELERKMKILMAYYFPGEASGPVPTRTPVNTFRSIFNRYFGARLELLPDRAFIYVRHDRPYRFRDVSERLGLIPS